MGNNIKTLQLKILDIQKISNFDINPEKYGLQGVLIKDSKIDYGTKVNLNPPKDMIEIFTFANFYLNENGKKNNLFGIEAKHIFQIIDFQGLFKTSDANTYKIPDEIMLTLLNISISGTRGMLALLNTRPEYKNLHFPIINSLSLLKGFKKNK